MALKEGTKAMRKKKALNISDKEIQDIINKSDLDVREKIFSKDTTDEDAKKIISAMNDDRAEKVYKLLSDKEAKKVFMLLPDDKAKKFIESMLDDRVKRIYTLLSDKEAKKLIKVMPDDRVKNIFMLVSDEETKKNRKYGRFILIILIIALLALGIFYCYIHWVYLYADNDNNKSMRVFIRNASEEPTNKVLEELIIKANKLNISIKEKISKEPQKSKEELEKIILSDVNALTNVVARIKSIWQASFRYIQTMSDQDKKVFGELITMVDTSMGNKDYEGVSKGLETMEDFISDTLPWGWFWMKGPLRFAEIMMWGMAGILANLIYTVGKKLSKEDFKRKEFVENLAYIFTIPLFTLVFVFFISQVKITVANNVEIDLADPYILVALSFAVGLIPKRIKEFLDNILNLGESES